MSLLKRRSGRLPCLDARAAIAKDAIKSCGGVLIDSLTYRGSYALIGQKDGALAVPR